MFGVLWTFETVVWFGSAIFQPKEEGVTTKHKGEDKKLGGEKKAPQREVGGQSIET